MANKNPNVQCLMLKNIFEIWHFGIGHFIRNQDLEIGNLS